jgi:DNA invertase Pin-like site-specific DNA recombinase
MKKARKHLRGARNGRAKLTEEQVAAIRASGEDYKILAARFSISTRQIYNLWNKKQWRVDR